MQDIQILDKEIKNVYFFYIFMYYLNCIQHVL